MGNGIRVLVAASIVAVLVGACGTNGPTPSPAPSTASTPAPTAAPPATPSPSPTIAPVEAKIADATRIKLKSTDGTYVLATRAGLGSLWISYSGSPNGWLVRVDLATHQVIAKIAVGESPGSIAITGGSVWVANDAGDGSRHFKGQNTLSRIDPATNTVASTLRVQVGGPIAGGLGAVWVPDYQNGDGNGQLARIDAATGLLTATFPVQGRPAVGCGTLWVIDGLVAVGGPEVAIVSAVDPATGLRKSQTPLITPGMEDPAKVGGECLTAWSTQDDPSAWSTGLVTPDVGVMRPSQPITGVRLRIMDGAVWAMRDDGAFQRLSADGAPAGPDFALPQVVTDDGVLWPLVVKGTGWAVGQKAVFVLKLP